MTQTQAAELAVEIVTAAGGSVEGMDEGVLSCRVAGRTLQVVLSDHRFKADRATAAKYVDQLINPPPVKRVANKWESLLNHAVLIRLIGDPGTLWNPIIDARVDAIAPSGNYVRFVCLSEPKAFWVEQDSYTLLEDLGERVGPYSQKPRVG